MADLENSPHNFNDWYRLFINAIDDMAFLKDDQLRYLVVNKANADFFGKPESEILGKKDSDLMTKEAAANCSASDLAALGKDMVVIVEEKVGNRYYETRKYKVPLLNGKFGVGGYIRDITEKKQIDMQMRESALKYHSLFEDAAVPIWEEDFSEVKAFIDNLKKAGVSDFRTYFSRNADELLKCSSLITILDVNHACVQMFQAESKREFIHLMPSTFVEESWPTFIEEIVALAEGKTEFEGEMPILDYKGNKKHVILKLRVSPESHQTLSRVFISLVDITRMKQFEDELLHAKIKAQESDQLKSAFLANMSHEIRTPVNAILGFSALLETNDITAEERNDYISVIHQNGNQLIRLINDILDISKIDSNQIVMSKITFNLNSFLDKLFSIFQNEKEARDKAGVSIRLYKALPHEDSMVTTDEVRLRQILSNLMENSLKFTDNGYIRFGYFVEDKILKFYVKDTGKGISLEKQNLVFERFRQEDETFTRKYGGSGLGLTISKALVNLLNGEMWLESTEGIGTSVYFTLPLVPFHQSGVEVSEQTEVKRTFDFSKKVVLIADDVYVNYELLKIHLKSTCAKVIYAENGKKAVDLFKAEQKVDLVLMDIQMPLMNGFDATKAIKHIDPEVPVIGITAFAFPEDRQRCLDAGCDDVITKPFERNAILQLLSDYLS